MYRHLASGGNRMSDRLADCSIQWDPGFEKSSWRVITAAIELEAFVEGNHRGGEASGIRGGKSEWWVSLNDEAHTHTHISGVKS